MDKVVSRDGTPTEPPRICVRVVSATSADWDRADDAADVPGIIVVAESSMDLKFLRDGLLLRRGDDDI
jgi:hypothetical protein